MILRGPCCCSHQHVYAKTSMAAWQHGRNAPAHLQLGSYASSMLLSRDGHHMWFPICASVLRRAMAYRLWYWPLDVEKRAFRTTEGRSPHLGNFEVDKT